MATPLFTVQGSFPSSAFKSFQGSKYGLNVDKVGHIRFPKIIILLPPLQNKTHLLCYFVAFEMTGILYCEEGALNKTRCVLVFATQPTDNYVRVLIEQ